MTKIIGVTGCAGSGKSTVVRLLADMGFDRLAFALPLKRAAQTVTAISKYDLFGPSHCRQAPLTRDDIAGLERAAHRRDALGKHLPDGVDEFASLCRTFVEAAAQREVSPTVRGLLEFLGQGMRDLDPDYWVRCAGLPSIQGLAAFEDVSYENESLAIRRHGGVIWRVMDPGMPLPEPTHSSTVFRNSALRFGEVLVRNPISWKCSLSELAETVRFLARNAVEGGIQ